MATTQPNATAVQAEALVAAFGIPDELLCAPIGLRDPAVAAAA